MSIPRLMVVEDDPEMQEMLVAFLRREGFAVQPASTGGEVEAIVARERIDLILLDVMLGDESGLEICRRLRAENDVPIIIVSALAADDARMQGYAAGADDYVAKPFNPELLLARIRAVARRTRRTPSLSYRRETRRFAFDGWIFEARSGRLTAASGYDVALSQREIALLKVFLANPFVPLTREEISAALDETGEAITAAQSRAIDVLVGRLRAKIEADPRNPALIQTVRGTGYMLAADVGAEAED
ncbi:MAG: response regulator transcription factor [Rubricella sp.]